MRRGRKRSRSIGIVVGSALIGSIGTLSPAAFADEPKPPPAPLPTTGPRPTPPPAPTTEPAASSPISEPAPQPTGSDAGSTGAEPGPTGSGGSGVTSEEDASGGAEKNDPVVGDGAPISRGLFDVDDVIGIGGGWMDSLATVLGELASAGGSITVDRVPCVSGRCEAFPRGMGLGTIIALAAILAGLAVIATASFRRSGWLLRH